MDLLWSACLDHFRGREAEKERGAGASSKLPEVSASSSMTDTGSAPWTQPGSWLHRIRAWLLKAPPPRPAAPEQQQSGAVES